MNEIVVAVRQKSSTPALYIGRGEPVKLRLLDLEDRIFGLRGNRLIDLLTPKNYKLKRLQYRLWIRDEESRNYFAKSPDWSSRDLLEESSQVRSRGLGSLLHSTMNHEIISRTKSTAILNSKYTKWESAIQKDVEELGISEPEIVSPGRMDRVKCFENVIVNGAYRARYNNGDLYRFYKNVNDASGASMFESIAMNCLVFSLGDMFTITVALVSRNNENENEDIEQFTAEMEQYFSEIPYDWTVDDIFHSERFADIYQRKSRKYTNN